MGIWCCSTPLNAQLTALFNTGNGVTTTGLRGQLQDKCWQFSHFNVNAGEWNPGIEGNGAMVTDASFSEMYTPLLKNEGILSISFSYQIKKAFNNYAKLKLTTSDASNNDLHVLDEIELTQLEPGITFRYHHSFSLTEKTPYKLKLSCKVDGGSFPIAIDQVILSADPFYKSGCNAAPVAIADLIDGNSNRTASGQLIINDNDNNREELTAYLSKNSPDGKVTINPDHTFSFLPDEGFSGNSTSFTYRVCNAGENHLCSDEAKVTIRFPNNENPKASLQEFSGSYQYGGRILLQWTTNFENETSHFDIERSMNGKNWQKTGEVTAQGASAFKKTYAFTDVVGTQKANSNDIYYRLRQVNTDQRIFVSRLLIVRVYNTPAVKMVGVTPNPAKNDISVQLQLNANAVAVLKIIDNNGTEVMRRAMHCIAGMNSYLMDGSAQIKAGLYVLEIIINSKERMLLKLIKE